MKGLSPAAASLGCLFFAACSCEPLFSFDASFACSSSNQCAPGFSCREGICQAGDFLFDAGRDAGPADAGPTDAGVRDAGIDAGAPDGGADAGVDAGSDAGDDRDAGFDAGAPDAGPPFDGGPAWTAIDIGNFVAPGTVNYSGNRITVAMHAGDIWNDLDDFYFLYQVRSGDLQITAQVFSIDAGSEWGKAGVMVRQALTRSSPNAFVMFSRDHAYGFQMRDAGLGYTGPGANLAPQPERAPYWVRLVRQNGVITAYQSADGGAFVAFGSLPDPFTDPVFVGLAVSSEVFTAGNIAEFRSVVLTTP